MKILFFLFITGSLLLFSLFESSYAEMYDINMPTGSASPDAPYFWQNEKTGEATGDIEIFVGDTVIWKNGDKAKHTITSGTLEGGPDGKFGGTDFLVPGEFYDFTFKKTGSYPYFCLIHPWMTGIVTVTNEGYKILSGVGQNVGDGLSSFDIEYQYSGVISSATVNQEEKSITFKLKNEQNLGQENLLMLLPSELIDGPYVIFIDGKKNLTFENILNDVNTIELVLPENSKQIKIIGSKIMPEFGILSIIILGIAISSIIFVQKSKIKIKY